MYIKNIKIKNFRTFDSYDEKGKELFELELDSNFQIIAGANNSGKTNLLRALNLFFNSETDDGVNYSRYEDMPYHKGKDGTSSPVNTEIIITLFLTTDDIEKMKSIKNYLIDNHLIIIKSVFKKDEILKFYFNKNNSFTKINKTDQVQKLINRVRFVYIPANTIIENKINDLVSDEILPSMIDSYGYGKSLLGKKIGKLSVLLKQSDKLASEILEEKNKLITEKFRNVIKDFPEITAGMDLNDFSLEVELIDESMSKVLARRINLSVKDSSHVTIESKGSGIQKLALISLLDYFSDYNEEKARFTNPFLIWAIDEPETFLQPKLQKKLREIFEKVSEKHQIIISTHSPKLIDINNTNNVKLFILETTKTTPIIRKNKKILTKKMTKFISKDDGNFITELKEHLGVEKNDGWIISEKNILFEGEDDKIYFDATFELIMGYKLDVSKISTNSSENMPNFIELLKTEFSDNDNCLLMCLLDNDNAGRTAYKKINKKTNIKTFKTISLYLKEEKIVEALKKEFNTHFKDKWNKSSKEQSLDEYLSKCDFSKYRKENEYKIIEKFSSEESKNYMMEDMIIPELFFRAIILQLKKIFNREINEYTFENFFKERQNYLGIPIMTWANNFFSNLIEEKRLDFTSLSMKYNISIKYREIILFLNKEEKEKYKNKYNILEIFFKGFL